MKNVRIVDFDNDGKDEADIGIKLSDEEMQQYDAVIYVAGGVANVEFKAKDVNVEINDYDNGEEDETLVNCSVCGESKDEGDINMDAESDICTSCEQEE
jgi:formylmethanofuran dehydrogenase subunit E